MELAGSLLALGDELETSTECGSAERLSPIQHARSPLRFRVAALLSPESDKVHRGRQRAISRGSGVVMVTLQGRFNRLFVCAAACWAFYWLLGLPVGGAWRANRHYDAEVEKCWDLFAPDREVSLNAGALRACREQAQASSARGVYSGFDFDWDEGERWSFEGYFTHMGQKVIGLISIPPLAVYASAWGSCWLIRSLSAFLIWLRRGLRPPVSPYPRPPK